MAESSTSESSTPEETPTIVIDVTSDDMPKEHVPIYCLTKLSDVEKLAYYTAITTEEEEESGYVLPEFIPWNEDHDGDARDMYRIWKEIGGNESYHHFAFFIDRQGLASTTIIIAEPDAIMSSSEEASQWARENLKSYLDRKPSPEGTEPMVAPKGTYEGFLLQLEDEILGKRGLSYGRVPALGFRSIYISLDVANANMSELVEYYGGTVEIYENPAFDMDGFMEKLIEVIREYIEGGGVLEDDDQVD